MLDDGAIRTYSDKSGDCATCIESVEVLRKLFNSPEKLSRFMTAWQNISLSQDMEKKLAMAEVEVLLSFVNQLTLVHKRLDVLYHGDHFLRYRLLTRVYILTIQSVVRRLDGRRAHKGEAEG